MLCGVCRWRVPFLMFSLVNLLSFDVLRMLSHKNTPCLLISYHYSTWWLLFYFEWSWELRENVMFFGSESMGETCVWLCFFVATSSSQAMPMHASHCTTITKTCCSSIELYKSSHWMFCWHFVDLCPWMIALHYSFCSLGIPCFHVLFTIKKLICGWKPW